MNIISNPDDQKTIKEHLEEFVGCQIRMAADRELANDILTDLEENFKESHELTKKIARRAGMIIYKQNQSEVNGLADDVDTLIEIASAK